MSILRDADWSLHQLRLAYLRRIDDHHGARIISFTRDEAAQSDYAVASSSKTTLADADTHIAIGRLDDSTKYPEISTAYSPIISSQPLHPPGRTKRGGPLAFTLSPSAPPSHRLRQASATPSVAEGPERKPSLRYTQTIYPAGRTGALGVRVSGKRAADSRSYPRRGTDSILPRHSLDAAPPQLEVQGRPRQHSDIGARTSATNLLSDNGGQESDVFEEEPSSSPSPAASSSPLPPVPSQGMTRTTSAGAVSPALEPPSSPPGQQRRRSATIDDSSTPSNFKLGVFPATPPGSIPTAQAPRDPAPPPPPASSSFTPSLPQKNPLRQSLRHLQSDSSLSSFVSSNASGSVENSPRPARKELPGDTTASASSSRTLSPPQRRARLPGSSMGRRMSESAVSDRNLIRTEDDGVELGAIDEQHEGASVDTMPVPVPRVRVEGSRRARGSSKASRGRAASPLPALSLEEQERQQNEFFKSNTLSPQAVAARAAAVGGISLARSSSQQSSTSKPSALSLLLQKQSTAPSNPFSQFYAGVSGRSAAAGSVTVEVYFPWSDGPADGSRKRSLTLSVRKDATMEELIGWGLYNYWEEGWLPTLEDKAAGSTEVPPDAITSTIGWVLRIVEDGEVDDDYPSLDRGLTVGKFGGDEFAICEASQAQVRQHAASYDAILRRSSRVVAAPTNAGGAVPAAVAGSAFPRTLKPSTAAAATLTGTTLAPPTGLYAAGLTSAAPGAAALGRTAPHAQASAFPGTPNAAALSTSSSAVPGTTLSSLAAGGTTAPAHYGNAPTIFLRILITPSTEVRYKTTLSVSSDMYLQDVLESICRRRQLGAADDWALVVPSNPDGAGTLGAADIVVPLDRTVESLQGSHDLVLVRRASLGAQAGSALASQSTNPNLSIFAAAEGQGATPTAVGGGGAIGSLMASNDVKLPGSRSALALSNLGGGGGGAPPSSAAGRAGLPPSATSSTLSGTSTLSSTHNLAHMLLAGSDNYRSWTVQRRLPPMLARGRNAYGTAASARNLLHHGHAGNASANGNQRTLTLDGDWVHLIPADAGEGLGYGGRLFGGGGTGGATSHAAASFSVGDVVGCRLSSAASAAAAALAGADGSDATGGVGGSGSATVDEGATGGGGSTHFKLTVMLKSGQKRFELEAETTREAAEIVREINARRERWARTMGTSVGGG